VKRYKTILIGVTFILSLALFIWGYNFLKGKNILQKQFFYYAKYESIEGLEVSNAVLIKLSQDFPVPKNSVARIFSADLMGSKSIDLKLGSAIELAHPGDTLASATEGSIKDEVNAQVQPIKIKAENLLSSIDSLVVAIQTIFNESARENLVESFNDIRLTFSNLERTTSNIDTLVESEANRIASILSNIDSVSLTLRDNRESISNIIGNLETFSDSLVKTDIVATFDKANKSLAELDEILTKINEGEGTLGMLLHNDTLYMEINKSAEELNKLLEDIRLNPKRYVKFSLF